MAASEPIEAGTSEPILETPRGALPVVLELGSLLHLSTEEPLKSAHPPLVPAGWARRVTTGSWLASLLVNAAFLGAIALTLRPAVIVEPEIVPVELVTLPTPAPAKVATAEPPPPPAPPEPQQLKAPEPPPPKVTAPRPPKVTEPPVQAQAPEPPPAKVLEPPPRIETPAPPVEPAPTPPAKAEDVIMPIPVPPPARPATRPASAPARPRLPVTHEPAPPAEPLQTTPPVVATPPRAATAARPIQEARLPPPEAVDADAARKALGAYAGRVRALIEARKSYPPLALRRHQQGSVLLRIVIDHEGRLIDVTAPPDAPEILAKASIAAVRAAAPFPSFPPALGRDRETFDLPIVFKLE